MKQRKKILVVSLFAIFSVALFGTEALAETTTKKSVWSDYFSYDESKMIKKLAKDHIYSLLKKDSGWKKLIKKEVSDGSIDRDKLKNGAVSTGKIADGAVTVAKMSSNSCTNGQILKFDGTTWACGEDNESAEATFGASIDSSEITDGTIAEADLANGAVTVAKMSSNSCTSGQVLKYNGSAWACAADSDSGGVLGSSIESGEITDGTIVDADINASAAIATSKINFTNQDINVGTGDLTLDKLIFPEFTLSGGVKNYVKLGDVNFISYGGADDLYVGYNAGTVGSSGSNTGFGNGVLNALTTGSSNNAFGAGSLGSNTTGNYNVAIGNSSLADNETGVSNTAIGVGVLYNAKESNFNTAIGRSSLNVLGDGDNSGNATLGNLSGGLLQSGSSNTLIGAYALGKNTSGNNNTALGYHAGGYSSASAHTGSNNTFIGYQSGNGNNLIMSSDISGSVFVGSQSGSLETHSNRLYIENSNADKDNALIYGEFDNDIIALNGVAKLKKHTSGTVPTCDAGLEGGTIYNDTSNYMCFCTGSAWKQFHSPATDCF